MHVPDIAAMLGRERRDMLRHLLHHQLIGLRRDVAAAETFGQGNNAERADLVLAGCAVLDAIRNAFPLPRLRVADRGLREGMLVEMMREDGALRT